MTQWYMCLLAAEQLCLAAISEHCFLLAAMLYSSLLVGHFPTALILSTFGQSSHLLLQIF